MSDFEPRKPSVFTPWKRRFTDERALELRETIALYNEVRALYERSRFNSLQARVQFFEEELLVPFDRSPFFRAIEDAVEPILWLEPAVFEWPDPVDWHGLSLQEAVDLRRFLRAKQHFLQNEPRVIAKLKEAIERAFSQVQLSEDEGDEIFSVPLVARLFDPPRTMAGMIATFHDPRYTEDGLFAELNAQLYANVCRFNNVEPHAEHKRRLRDISDADLPALELVDAFLADTPLRSFFLAKTRLSVPRELRFEHHYILAGTGHGKTSTIQTLIDHDLQLVRRDQASIIVIDSQNALIPTISRLPDFAPGGALDGRLVLVDPRDIDFPTQLSLFDLGINAGSRVEQERMRNIAVEVLEFVIGSLLDAEMTSKQSGLFSFVIRLLLEIPGATIHTFRALMLPDGHRQFKPYIDKLPTISREFFTDAENGFPSKQYADTKTQIQRRLYRLLNHPTWERMFSSAENRLDLGELMNEARVILISTDKDFLGKEGTTTFGRFFIALLSIAIQRRASQQKKLPTFAYIDEAHEYIQNDTYITTILEQARKQNVGVILAHQFLSQISGRVQDTILGNTSIKFVGGVPAPDRARLAREMRTTPEFIDEQPKFTFAAYLKGVTASAISVPIKYGALERHGQMRDDDFEIVRDSIRAEFGKEWRDEPQAEEVEPEVIHASGPVTDAEAVEIDPSRPAKW